MADSRDACWHVAEGITAVIAIAALCAPAKATQYDLVPLDTSPFSGGQANSAWEGQAVGDVSGVGGVLWRNPASYVSLTPSGYGGSVINGIWGNQQVGWVPAPPNANGNKRAALWNGSASTFVDLSGGTGISSVDGTDGVQQVGVLRGGAALWTGTAASYVNLSPITYPLSEALAVWNGEQVGYGGDVPNTDALLWRGSADSYMVLKSGAEARGISRGQVVGYAGIGGTNVAALWANATPESFANLAPANTTASELFATNGVQQVGDVSLTIGSFGQLPVDHHAGVWHATPSSFQMLPIPKGLNYSIATGIDGNGDISGYVGIQSGGGVGGFSPVLWTQPHLPGDANFDGSVGFDDLATLAAHYGKVGEWVDGDFNGDGIVNFSDLVVLAQNYGKTQCPAPAYSIVTPAPDPAAPAAALALALALCRGVPRGGPTQDCE